MEQTGGACLLIFHEPVSQVIVVPGGGVGGRIGTGGQVTAVVIAIADSIVGDGCRIVYILLRYEPALAVVLIVYTITVTVVNRIQVILAVIYGLVVIVIGDKIAVTGYADSAAQTKCAVFQVIGGAGGGYGGELILIVAIGYKGICIDEPAGFRVVVATLEVIQPRLGWVLLCTRRGCPLRYIVFSVCTCRKRGTELLCTGKHRLLGTKGSLLG